jgi:alpha-L-fucosidase
VLKTDELIDQYHPDIMWFDNGVNSRAYDPLKLKVAAYYYNRALQWHKQVTIETKDSAFLAGSVLDFEKLNPRGPTRILKGIWDAEEPIGSTWGYSAENPVETFRSAQSVINELSTILSMNGSLLLNLSPNGQGGVNDAQRTTLKEVGKWLAVNGEAVYGTHNWIIDGEGFTPLPPRSPQMRRPRAAAAAASEQGARAGAENPPTPRAPAATPPPAAPEAASVESGPKPVVYRFTVKDDALYAIAQSWPGETAVITSLANGKALDGQVPEGKIKSVALLGHKGNLKFTQDAEGLKIQLPADRPCDYAFAFKIGGLKMNRPGPPVPAVMADLR